jgi:phenylpyruvate tautomerase PptA (4-oxalocrotonate tautomerase family)
MPLYEVSHVAPLTKAQKDEMALAITKLQCSKFGTPSLFVTVLFAETTGLEAYVAGNPVSFVLESGYIYLYQRLLIILHLTPIIIVLPVI